MAKPVGDEQPEVAAEAKPAKAAKSPKIPERVKVLESVRISGECSVIPFTAGQIVEDPHVVAFLIRSGAKIESC